MKKIQAKLPTTAKGWVGLGTAVVIFLAAVDSYKKNKAL